MSATAETKTPLARFGLLPSRGCYWACLDRGLRWWAPRRIRCLRVGGGRGCRPGCHGPRMDTATGRCVPELAWAASDRVEPHCRSLGPPQRDKPNPFPGQGARAPPSGDDGPAGRRSSTALLHRPRERGVHDPRPPPADPGCGHPGHTPCLRTSLPRTTTDTGGSMGEGARRARSLRQVPRACRSWNRRCGIGARPSPPGTPRAGQRRMFGRPNSIASFCPARGPARRRTEPRSR